MKDSVLGKLIRLPNEGWLLDPIPFLGGRILWRLVSTLTRQSPDLRCADPMFEFMNVIIEDPKGQRPSSEQRQAFHLMNQKPNMLAQSIAGRVFEKLTRVRHEREELAASLPAYKSDDALRKKLKASEVRIEQRADGGVAYAMMSLSGYTEEPDSGVEVVLHGDRVVEVGDLREEKRGRRRIEHPLLGTLSLDEEYGWLEGKVQLPQFVNFYARGANSPEVEDESQPDEQVPLTVLVKDEDEDEDPQVELSPAQEKAAEQLMHIMHEVAPAILRAALKDYQQQYADRMEWVRQWADEGEREKVLPKIEDNEDLKQVIELTGVTLHRAERDGVAYVGFEFNCTWDEEHGYGVLTRDGKVVAIGDSDVVSDAGGWEDEQRGKW